MIVQHGHGGFGPLGGEQEPEGIAAIGVHHGVQLVSADALRTAKGKGVLAEHLSPAAAFHVALAEGGVLLLQKLDLLRGKVDGLLAVPALEH